MSDRRHWMLGAVSLAMGGCTPPRRPTARGGPPLWPGPPEMPRYVYEATLRNGNSLRDESASAQFRQLLTGEDASKATFGKPWAVAARAGRIYVSDTEGRRVFVFDVPRRRTYSFGFRREGELKKPGGLAVDDHGRVYVVDSSARRVVVFDALGLFLGDIDGARSWTRPTAVAVSHDGERLMVVDTGGVDSDDHRIWMYGAQGRPLGTLGRRGQAAGEFNLPTDAVIGADGTLWVLDGGNFRVQAFDASNRFLRAFGSVGNGLGQFARPRGLAVDPQGRVYVSDASFCNVQVFQPSGELLLAIGGRVTRQDEPGHYLLPAKLACDETGRLYVVDQFLHKVEVLRHLSEREARSLMQPA